jgi:hypothetical protein
VAAVAGVSTATVSAVVNGRASQYGICRATQEKVLAAIRQMGYAPSLSALDMVAGRNSLVGLAITTDYPGSERLIAAMEPALAQAGFRLLVICLPADSAAAVDRITNLVRYGIGGLAIFPARALPLPGIACPVVMVGKAGVGLPSDCSPSAVNQLGLATARWLQMASQGMPPGELLLEPVPAVTPTNPALAPSPPLRPPPSVPHVSVPKPPAVSVSNPPALSPAEVSTSVQEPQAAPNVIPEAPVEEPTVSPSNSATEQPENPPEQPSESIQMPETMVADPAGQPATDPQGTVPEGSEVEPVPVPEPVPAPEVVTPPEPEVSQPVPEIVMPELVPEPIAVVREGEPVPGVSEEPTL